MTKLPEIFIYKDICYLWKLVHKLHCIDEIDKFQTEKNYFL